LFEHEISSDLSFVNDGIPDPSNDLFARAARFKANGNSTASLLRFAIRRDPKGN
jgi:hypothetical protein